MIWKSNNKPIKSYNNFQVINAYLKNPFFLITSFSTNILAWFPDFGIS